MDNAFVASAHFGRTRCRLQKVAEMSTKLVVLTLATLLGFSQIANAGVIMYVHFGDNAPDTFSLGDKGSLVTAYSPNASTGLTANIYLHLTEGTTIYGYRFSVRYDGNALEFRGRQQYPIAVVNPPSGSPPPYLPFVRDETIELEDGNRPEPKPVKASDASSAVQNGKDLYRFNGVIETNDNFGGTGFYRLASITFALIPQADLLPGRPLIDVGKFEFSPNDVQLRDAIRTEDKDSKNDYVIYDIQSFGGSVSGGSVPEPTSAIAFVVIGVVALYRRKRRTGHN